jgi:hypothetical protein
LKSQKAAITTVAAWKPFDLVSRTRWVFSVLRLQQDSRPMRLALQKGRGWLSRD